MSKLKDALAIVTTTVSIAAIHLATRLVQGAVYILGAKVPPPEGPRYRYVVIAQHTHPADDPVCFRPPLVLGQRRPTGNYCRPEIVGYVVAHDGREAYQIAMRRSQFRTVANRELIMAHESLAKPADLDEAQQKNNQWTQTYGGA